MNKDQLEVAIMAIERRLNCKVLFWNVMGSRQWGFNHDKSDYNLHFVFAFPAEQYASLEGLPAKSVVFKYEEFEFQGWELRDYMTMCRKSNTFPMELLLSDNIQGPFPQVASRIRWPIANEHFNPVPMWHHHSSLARSEYHKFKESGGTDMKVYLYMCRSIFMALWLEQVRRVHDDEYSEIGYDDYSYPHDLIYLMSLINLPVRVQDHITYLVKLRKTNPTAQPMIDEEVVKYMLSLMVGLVVPANPEKNRFGDGITLNSIMTRIVVVDAKNYHLRYDPAPVGNALEMIRFDLDLRADPTPRKERRHNKE